jgi:NAD(P)-dependent dehydrogenase (short-subunit alcohol dehydrogenase family)
MRERVAVVFGGASGIGAATARALAVEDYHVTIADRSGDTAKTLAAELGSRHTGAQVDVLDEVGVASVLDAVLAREGSLDVVVNCAGVSTIGLITDLTVEDFRQVVDVNLTGGFIVFKQAGRRIRDDGVIIALASLNARQPGTGLSAYCSAKAGLAMLVQVAALELGERGVRVNAVSPGLVPTPLTAPALEIPGVQAEYLENTPLGRTGTAQEVAAVIRFLCSDEAGWLTGTVLDLNGGAHLRRYPDLLAHINRAFG